MSKDVEYNLQQERINTMKRQKNGTWKLTDAEMNLFSILAFEARERYESIGKNALAKNAHKISHQIYDVLDSAGYYNE